MVSERWEGGEKVGFDDDEDGDEEEEDGKDKATDKLEEGEEEGAKKKKKGAKEIDVLRSISANADGSVTIETNIQNMTINQRTMKILEAARCKGYSKWRISHGGYLDCGFQNVNRLLGDDIPKNETRWRPHFEAYPHDNLEMVFLDSNKMNINIENLQWIPRMLRSSMRKSYPRRTKSGMKFCAAVQFGRELRSTKCVSTYNESLHTVDILKLVIAPWYFRDFLFLHSMHRPADFAQHYVSIETLLSRQDFYEKQFQSKPKPRQSKNIYAVYRSLKDAVESISEATLSPVLDMLKLPQCKPFDPSVDCIVHYNGSLGKQFVTLIEYADYKSLMMQKRPSMVLKKWGQIEINFEEKSQYLHNVILGRKVGDRNRDGLLGAHEVGCELDCRRRMLKVQTASEHASSRFLNRSVPEHVGVWYDKAHKKFRAVIKIYNLDIVLGSFDSKEEAAACYNFAYANKGKLYSASKDMDLAGRRRYIRNCAKASLILNDFEV